MQRLADSNLWLALTLTGHVFHQPARAWLASLPDDDQLLFCRATQQTYLRLLTTKEVLAPYGNPPLSNATALSKYDAWLATGRAAWADEPPGLEAHWRRFAGQKLASPKLWMDAYLAAFAVAGDYQLATTDTAFKQFKGLDCAILGRAS